MALASQTRRPYLPGEQAAVSLELLHASYKSLILARLRRDFARAAAISARASLAADGLKSAILVPANTDPLFSASAAADIQGPVVSGVGQGSGEYFSRMGVGLPARQIYMALDTGSDSPSVSTLCSRPWRWDVRHQHRGGTRRLLAQHVARLMGEAPVGAHTGATPSSSTAAVVSNPRSVRAITALAEVLASVSSSASARASSLVMYPGRREQSSAMGRKRE